MKRRVEVSYNTNTQGMATEFFDEVTDVYISEHGQLTLEGQGRRLIALFNSDVWTHATSVEVDE